MNSKKGTQFRIWANKVLKEYLLEGCTLNEFRLKQQIEKIDVLKETLLMFQRAQQEFLENKEARGLLSLLTEYTLRFVLLNQYDAGNLPRDGLTSFIACSIEKNEATLLFGNPKDDSFSGILDNIVQNFNGECL